MSQIRVICFVRPWMRKFEKFTPSKCLSSLSHRCNTDTDQTRVFDKLNQRKSNQRQTRPDWAYENLLHCLFMFTTLEYFKGYGRVLGMITLEFPGMSGSIGGAVEFPPPPTRVPITIHKESVCCRLWSRYHSFQILTHVTVVWKIASFGNLSIDITPAGCVACSY